MIGNSLYSGYIGQHDLKFMDYFTVNVLFEAIGIFVFVRTISERIFNEAFWKIIYKLSRLSLGAYLIHVMILYVYKHFGITPMMVNPLIGTPIIFLSVCFTAYFFSWILSKIPVLRQFV